jgi:hypothetical protein
MAPAAACPRARASATPTERSAFCSWMPRQRSRSAPVGGSTRYAPASTSSRRASHTAGSRRSAHQYSSSPRTSVGTTRSSAASVRRAAQASWSGSAASNAASSGPDARCLLVDGLGEQRREAHAPARRLVREGRRSASLRHPPQPQHSLRLGQPVVAPGDECQLHVEGQAPPDSALGRRHDAPNDQPTSQQDLRRAASSRYRDLARSDHLDQSEGAHHPLERLDLVVGAGHLDRHRALRDVHGLAAEDLGELHHLGA